MENKFEYVNRKPINHNILQEKGFEKVKSAMFNIKDSVKFYIINNIAKTYWIVDKLGFEDANNRVKHITGKEIQPYKA